MPPKPPQAPGLVLNAQPSDGNFLHPLREIREKADAPRTNKHAVTGETRIAPQDRDDLLLRRAAKGDEEAFTLLYRRHQGALYRFALRMTGSAWGAEEIVQDVFMTLIRAPQKYRSEEHTSELQSRVELVCR